MRTLEDSVYRIGEARVSISRAYHKPGWRIVSRPAQEFRSAGILDSTPRQILLKDEIFREVWPTSP